MKPPANIVFRQQGGDNPANTAHVEITREKEEIETPDASFLC
jgi:hypothetical protein